MRIVKDVWRIKGKKGTTYYMNRTIEGKINILREKKKNEKKGKTQT